MESCHSERRLHEDASILKFRHEAVLAQTGTLQAESGLLHRAHTQLLCSVLKNDACDLKLTIRRKIERKNKGSFFRYCHGKSVPSLLPSSDLSS
jgi:hypothetical protein